MSHYRDEDRFDATEDAPGRSPADELAERRRRRNVERLITLCTANSLSVLSDDQLRALVADLEAIILPRGEAESSPLRGTLATQFAG